MEEWKIMKECVDWGLGFNSLDTDKLIIKKTE